ncbi:MAG: hypothetical protein OPY06_05560 [Nitrosopumilus sp.]|nr:hypothetical protein [Nitrosopumilus sp.]MDF2422736.1 hypothetical protein [Nitrosopumilus sp.]MDF2424555.1 hypothetical protein [Nitrosopumilus sp.]MDF2425944.1 hypothetical protein [Nitrosopumilus sp.]MDF2426943.1 hypothetical protein [Nitrosopumilus sp.]
MFDIPLVERIVERTVETITKLYTKTFTQETWDNLDFPIPELGYSMTMQKFLESKYTILIEEEKRKVDCNEISLLAKVIRQNNLCSKGNKLKKKFLQYAEIENKEHLESFINGLNFEGTLVYNPKKNPRAVHGST